MQRKSSKNVQNLVGGPPKKWHDSKWRNFLLNKILVLGTILDNPKKHLSEWSSELWPKKRISEKKSKSSLFGGRCSYHPNIILNPSWFTEIEKEITGFLCTIKAAHHPYPIKHLHSPGCPTSKRVPYPTGDGNQDHPTLAQKVWCWAMPQVG